VGAQPAVKVTIVSVHLPEPEGTAAGRALHALCEGLLAEHHELEVWSWRPEPPATPPPPWCRWEPLPAEPRWRTRARALARPRRDVVAARWVPPTSGLVIADDPLSFPAVETAASPAVTFHYSARLDDAALGVRTAASIQDARAERRIAGTAAHVLAYSARVAATVGPRAVFVPIAYAARPDAFPAVAEPVAACVADWTWPPNRVALDALLAAWPIVRSSVASATLRLAGRGLDDVGTIAGVEVLGPVGRSEDVLASAAVVAFPCPSTSGPKVKVLESLAGGRAVVTTEAGIEGLCAGALAGARIVSATADPFGAALADVLRDPTAVVDAAAAARAAVMASHGPVSAAKARIEALTSEGR
jgi:glycosyltransferase involved in cell wall biosynthesis